MPRINRSNTIVALAGAVTAAALASLTPASKLERLTAREKIKAALNLPKEAIISREAGHIDIVVAESLYTAAQLQRAVQDAAAANGIQVVPVGVATSEDGVTKFSFTNDLMQAQAQWGARGNSRQLRVLSAMPVSEAVKTNSAPPKSTRKNKGAQAAQVTESTKSNKGKGKRRAKATA